MFTVKTPSDKFNYEWQTPSGHKIKKRDKRFKDSNTATLKIECFENKYRGAYTCVVSTIQEPKLSISAEVAVDFQCK